MSKRGRVAALIGILVCAAYSTFVEPDWIDVSRHDLRSEPSGAPLRIVLLSDLHLTALGSRESAIAAAVDTLRPDLVVVSGDAIDRADAVPLLERFLAMLGATPKVAVLGNWEYWSGADRESIRRVYAASGTTLLVDAWTTLRLGGRTLHVGGADDHTAGTPRLPAPPASAEPSTSLIVQHSPGWFDEPDGLAAAGSARLCLSGHTHGGQITFFGHPVWTPPGSGRFEAGWYETPGCRLYVSRGLGTSLVPVRFGSRPEIAVFDL